MYANAVARYRLRQLGLLVILRLVCELLLQQRGVRTVSFVCPRQLTITSSVKNFRQRPKKTGLC